MQFKAASDYAVRIMLYLLVQNRVCSAQEIAEGTGIDRMRIVQAAKGLRRSGLITSVRGARGGYASVGDSETLMFRDIVESFEDATSITHRSHGKPREDGLHRIETDFDSFVVSYQPVCSRLGEAFEIPLRELLEALESQEEG